MARNTDSHPKPAVSGKNDGRGRPGRSVICYETGEVFPSTKEAALSVGAAYPSRIATAIARHATVGGFHWYYADQPKPAQAELTDPDARKNGRSVVCWETREAFPSAAVAAEAMGLKAASKIRVACREGIRAAGFHWYYADQPRPDESALKGDRGRPGISIVCVENGEVYPSAAAAAKAAGLKNSACILAAAKGGGCAGGFHWRFEEDEEPGASGQGASSTRGRTRPVVCWETGEEFESVKAAANAMGFETSTAIVAAIKRGGTSGGFHWHYRGAPKPDASQLSHPEDRAGKPVVCKETGHVYPNATEAAEAMGLKSAAGIYTAIHKKTKSGGFHWDWKAQ